jgi:hypothetical protein
VIAALLSDELAWITGEQIELSGGYGLQSLPVRRTVRLPVRRRRAAEPEDAGQRDRAIRQMPGVLPP